jgi:all-trans-retinol 13,14-reductase
MAGLTAGILLAREGHAVTVLEQHTRFGGFLHRFFRRGVGFDTGFHYVGAARPHQLFGRAMAHLGVRDALSWTPLDADGFDILRFPGFEVRVPEGLDRWLDRLAERFPAEREGIARYGAMHRAAVSSYSWFNLDYGTLPESVLPWETRSVSDVVAECFGDPRLRAVVAGQAALYGVPPRDAPFGMHAIVTDHFLQGAWSVQGGGDHLARALVRRLRSLGGELHLKARVNRLEVAGGHIAGVHTEDGRRFDADLVFADIHPRAVLPLLPEGAVRPAYATRVREARTGRAHFGVYLRVKGDLDALGNRNLYRFSTWDVDSAETPATPERIPFFFVTAPGCRPHAAVPGADQVVLGLVNADYHAFAEALEGGSRGAAYQDLKHRLLDATVSAVLADFPGWEVLDSEASTPLTTERFTASPMGATYGHYHSVAQMGRYRLPIATRVRGLVQVGQAVGFPGICGAMMSAYVACGELMGVERLMRELREA